MGVESKKSTQRLSACHGERRGSSQCVHERRPHWKLHPESDTIGVLISGLCGESALNFRQTERERQRESFPQLLFLYLICFIEYGNYNEWAYLALGLICFCAFFFQLPYPSPLRARVCVRSYIWDLWQRACVCVWDASARLWHTVLQCDLANKEIRRGCWCH